MTDEVSSESALATWAEGFSDEEAVAMAKQLGGRQTSRKAALAHILKHPEEAIREAWAALREERWAQKSKEKELELVYDKPLSFFYNKQYHLKAGSNTLPEHVARHISNWLRGERQFHELREV